MAEELLSKKVIF